MTGFVDQFPHVRRHVAGEAQPVAGDRMIETEHCGMERLARKSGALEHRAKLRERSAVQRISH
jgi:hypothetical protein